MGRFLSFPAGVLLLLAVILAAVIGFRTFDRPVPDDGARIAPTRTVAIGGTQVRVAVADTDALRERGLGGYAPLEEDEGMLFVFPQDGIYPFWMKGMRFALDIIWIDGEGNVVFIAPGVAPDSYPQSFTPDSPARYVLEVRAGFAGQHDIRIGTRASVE